LRTGSLFIGYGAALLAIELSRSNRCRMQDQDELAASIEEPVEEERANPYSEFAMQLEAGNELQRWRRPHD